MSTTIITIEGIQNELNALKAQLNDLCETYNGFGDEEEKAVVDKTLNDLESGIAQYNEKAWKLLILETLQSGDRIARMKFVVERMFFEGLSLKDKNIGEKDAPIIVKEIEPKKKRIDLTKLNKDVSGGIGTEKWLAKTRKFNMLMTLMVGDEVKQMDTATKKVFVQTVTNAFGVDVTENGADVTVSVSKNKMIDTVQSVVDAMLGEGYKATKWDANFVDRVYGALDPTAVAVKCLTDKKVREVFLVVCHKLVTGTTYEVVSRELKKAK